MPGNSGSSGTTIVCCSATTVPHSDRIPTIAEVETARADRAAAVAGAAKASSLRSRDTEWIGDELYGRRNVLGSPIR